MLKDVFGFAEHPDKATYDFGYKLTITRNKDAVAFEIAVGIADVRLKIDTIQ